MKIFLVNGCGNGKSTLLGKLGDQLVRSGWEVEIAENVSNVDTKVQGIDRQRALLDKMMEAHSESVPEGKIKLYDRSVMDFIVGCMLSDERDIFELGMEYWTKYVTKMDHSGSIFVVAPSLPRALMDEPGCEVADPNSRRGSFYLDRIGLGGENTAMLDIDTVRDMIHHYMVRCEVSTHTLIRRLPNSVVYTPAYESLKFYSSTWNGFFGWQDMVLEELEKLVSSAQLQPTK